MRDIMDRTDLKNMETTIDDFEESDFTDPIVLLDAIKHRKEDLVSKRKKESSIEGFFFQNKDCLLDRTRLKECLSETLMGDKLHVNVILTAYDMGIIDNIEKAKELDEAFISMECHKLVSEYGLSGDNALYAVEFWLKEYARGYLGKEVVSSSDAGVRLSENNSEVSQKHVSQKRKGSGVLVPTDYSPVNPNKNLFNFSSLGDSFKLPKWLINRDQTGEKKYGIDNCQMLLYKEFDFTNTICIKIVGEMSGHATFARSLLLIFVVHNDKGEPISMNASTGLTPEKLNDGHTFETSLRIPKDELISEILVRFIEDPVFI